MNRTPIFISLLIVLIGGCKKDNPASSNETAIETKYVRLADYGMIIDSLYYKNWSDGSWEKFGGVETINGKKYIYLINNTNDRYYYNERGYCGLKAGGKSIIIFETPVPSIGDSVGIGNIYGTSTTFKYSGYSYTITYIYTIKDLSDVQMTLMKFSNCLKIEAEVTISAEGESEKAYATTWEAVGPSTIKQVSNNSNSIGMMDGCVNGKIWNVSKPGTIYKLQKNVDNRVTAITTLLKIITNGYHKIR